MPPYRARLSGVFGSDVQMPRQRQPVVDVGSIIDAISGAKDASVRREFLKADRARQQVQDQRAEEDRQRGIASERAQMERQTRLDSEQSVDRTYNRQMTLAKAISEGYQPTAPRQIAPVGGAGLPGMGGVQVPVPGHYDPMQSAAVKVGAFNHLRDRREKAADTGQLYAQQEKIARIRGTRSGSTAGQFSDRDRVRAISTMALQLMKPTKAGRFEKPIPGMDPDAAFKEAGRRVNMATSAARGTQAPATGAPAPRTAEQKAVITLQRVTQGLLTVDQALAPDSPISDEVKALVRQKLSGRAP